MWFNSNKSYVQELYNAKYSTEKQHGATRSDRNENNVNFYELIISL